MNTGPEAIQTCTLEESPFAPDCDVLARLAEIERLLRSIHQALIHDRPDGPRKRHHSETWRDQEVRRFVESHYSTCTIDACLAAARARFGTKRAPSRSAIGRFWKAMDNQG